MGLIVKSEINNTLYLILSFIAVFSIPVISFVKKQMGQLGNGPKVVVGTGYGGKDGPTPRRTWRSTRPRTTSGSSSTGTCTTSPSTWTSTRAASRHHEKRGGDATKGFHGPQHPSRVMDIVDEYKIGTLVTRDTSKDE